MEKSARIEQELPADLIFEILARLPVKSLCRFRCVSKLWRSVIADPGFVEAHHACSRARPELLIFFRGLTLVDGTERLIRHGYTCKLDAVGMELHYSPHNGGPSQTFHTVVSHQRSAFERGYVYHQAGGLYCLGSSDYFRVWNPSTRESVGIQTLETDAVFSKNINHFGFDPVEKKHKVLNILTQRFTGKAIRSRVFVLEETRWRTPANAYPPHLPLHRKTSVVCIDGIIFSVANTSQLPVQEMLAFHVRSETFEVIQLPESAVRKRLVDFTGRATVVNYNSPDPGEEITLWILEDFRKRVWTRKSCVIPGYNLRLLTLQGSTPAGELLFTGGKKLREPFFLLLYSVESNVARRIEVRGLHADKLKRMSYVAPAKVHVHVESLKSPRRSFLFNTSNTYQDPQRIGV